MGKGKQLQEELTGACSWYAIGDHRVPQFGWMVGTPQKCRLPTSRIDCGRWRYLTRHTERRRGRLSGSNQLLTPRRFLILLVHIGSVHAFSYAAAGAMFTFDRESHRTLRNDQKQFPELSDDRKHGYKAQDGECQTARQVLDKRNARPDRANAKF